MTTDHTAFLELAVQEAVASVEVGGGPFGAVIVRAGAALARGTNRVTLDNDPTAHAEIVAIRGAAYALNTHRLTGCVLYCSCEPCPMCLGAVLWSHLDAVFYAADRHDAAAADFDDARFYDALTGSGGGLGLPLVQVPLASRAAPFIAWQAKPDRIPY
jgi:guanine deaminase